MVKELKWNKLGNIRDANLNEWPKTMKKLLKKFPESKIVIPGHGKYGNLNLIHHTLELLKNN